MNSANEPAPGRPAARGASAAPITRAPFRAWLVTGPIGRLTGFLIEFATALWALARDRRQR